MNMQYMLQAQAEANAAALRAAAELADSRAQGADLRMQLREALDTAAQLQQDVAAADARASKLEQQLQVSPCGQEALKAAADATHAGTRWLHVLAVLAPPIKRIRYCIAAASGP